LNMRKKIEQMEEEVNRFLEYITKEFFQGREDEIEKRRRDLVRIMPAKIIIIEKEKE